MKKLIAGKILINEIIRYLVLKRVLYINGLKAISSPNIDIQLC